MYNMYSLITVRKNNWLKSGYYTLEYPGLMVTHSLSQAFGQFDAEGDGIVDVENMLMVLKSCNGANLQGELSHVIRQLQACSLTPGTVAVGRAAGQRRGAVTSWGQI